MPVDFLKKFFTADFTIVLAAGLAAETLIRILEGVLNVDVFPVLAMIWITDRFSGNRLLEADLITVDFSADTTGLEFLDHSRDTDLVLDFLVETIYVLLKGLIKIDPLCVNEDIFIT